MPVKRELDLLDRETGHGPETCNVHSIYGYGPCFFFRHMAEEEGLPDPYWLARLEPGMRL
jgi:hypothetical protein